MENETPNTFKFEPGIQAKIVALLLMDPDSLGDTLSVLKPEFFDNPIDQKL